MGAVRIMQKKRCIIFAGAEMKSISDLQIDSETFIICADGGYENALKFGVKPDIAMGDFDTIDSNSVKVCEKVVYPPEKDDTDTMIAVKTALERGYDDITITGGLGGRLDHTIANIQTLVYISEHGADGRIMGDDDSVMILKNSSGIYERREGYKFSLFSMTEKSSGITTKGLKYNLDNGELKYSFPLGVSNEIISESCEIEIKNGILLIIFSKDMNQN